MGKKHRVKPLTLYSFGALALFGIVLVGIGIIERGNDPVEYTDASGETFFFTEDEDYVALPGIAETSAPLVTVFFSAACPHCNEFHEHFAQWIEQKPTDVRFEAIPVLFDRSDWASLARVYAIGRQLEGAPGEFLHHLFDALHEKRIAVHTRETAKAYFSFLGYDSRYVDALWNDEQTQKWLGRYLQNERDYNVRSIPRLIINGRYEIPLNNFKKGEESNRKMFALVDYLLGFNTPAPKSS